MAEVDLKIAASLLGNLGCIINLRFWQISFFIFVDYKLCFFTDLVLSRGSVRLYETLPILRRILGLKSEGDIVARNSK